MSRFALAALAMLLLAVGCSTKQRPPVPGEIVRLGGPWRMECDGEIRVQREEGEPLPLTLGIVPLTLKVDGWATDSTVVLDVAGLSVSGAGRLPGDVRGLAVSGELFVTGAAKDSVIFRGQGLRWTGRLQGDEFVGTVGLDPEFSRKHSLRADGPSPDWRLFPLTR